MTPVHVIEPDFLPRDSIKYRLLLLLSKSSLSFAVTSPLGRLLVLSRLPIAQGADRNAYLNQVRKWLQNQQILHRPYKDTVIALDLKAPTLLPGTGHSQDDLQHAASLLFPADDSEVLGVSEDDQLNISFLYPVHDELYRLLQNFFPKAVILHNAVSRVRNAFLYSAHTPRNLVSFHISLPFFSAVVFHKGRLKFYNQYACESPNDLVYYAMLVTNKLRLKAESAQFILSGQIAHDSEYVRQLQRYIPGIERTDTKAWVTFSDQSIRWAAYFTDLFSLLLCA